MGQFFIQTCSILEYSLRCVFNDSVPVRLKGIMLQIPELQISLHYTYACCYPLMPCIFKGHILGLGDSMVVRYYRQWSTIVIYIHIYYYSEICYRDSDVVKYSLVIR